MAKFSPADSGYVEVKDRIVAFWDKYPDGAIRTNIYQYDDSIVIVGAEVFADRHDEAPIGTGFSQLKIPGSTPFTKDSELENAETSAVGRAIAMAGFEVHKSVASADEIEMKSGSPTRVAASSSSALDDLKKEVRTVAEALYGPDWKADLKEEFGIDGRSGEEALRYALSSMRSDSAAYEVEEDDVEVSD